MMRILLFLCFWPSILAAEPANIRSGEHDTFSRLVISIPNDASWTILPTDDGYVLTVEPLEEGFGTTTIFDRIPRGRISDARSQGENQLVLDIACQCHIHAFLWQSDKLVVDVGDGPAHDDNHSEYANLAGSVEQLETVQVLPDLMLLRSAQPSALNIDLEQVADPSNSVVPDLDATEAALIEALARAASQGFLDAPPQVSTEPDEMTKEIEPPAETPDVPEIQEEVSSPHPGVGIATALDRDLAIIGEALEQSVTRHCLPEDLFAMADWADERALHSQTAELIEALVGDFGQEPLMAQNSLARVYIYFGFGAEARGVLSQDPASSQERQVLIELARFVDEEPGPFELLSSQADCETVAAVWAFLLEPKELDRPARDRILRDFSSIPQPLRSQIAPRMSEAFLNIGDADAADKVLDATRNRDTETNHETQAARAEVALGQDDPELALTVLSEQAEDNARTTPASLIRLINLALEEGNLPKEADLVLASALRQEYRTDPISDDLAIAQARGHAALGEFEIALDIVSDRDDIEAQSVNDEVFALIAKNADTTRFLEFSYGSIPQGLTPNTENEMARRLMDLGFAERTRVFLSGSAQDDAARDRRYLRAEAALAMRDFSGAIEALEGMTDERANLLSVEAYSGMGNHDAALLATANSTPSPDQSELQFRAQAWESLATQEDPVLSSFAETVLNEPPSIPPATLADRRAILGESEQSRQNVEALLQRFDGITGDN